MDYKYIEQLLERYWQCETSLQEEAILRAFFSQEGIPVWLLKYKALFAEQAQKAEPLGDDFDARLLAMTEQRPVVEARTASLTSRLMPLFKAAAVVAIVLTLGNAAQAPWDRGWSDPKAEYAKFHQQPADSADVLAPMRAENLFEDSSQAIPPVNPKY